MSGSSPAYDQRLRGNVGLELGAVLVVNRSMAIAATDKPRSAARRRKLRFTVAAVACVVLIVMYAGQAYWLVRWEVAHRLAAELPGRVTFRDISISEPSGIAYHQQRQSILVVSDNGLMVEFDLDCKKRHSWEISGDLEGISLHPGGSIAYVADEDDGSIIEFDLDSGTEIRRTRIDFNSHPDFAGGVNGNQGLEGLAVYPAQGDDGRPVLAGIIENDPPRWIKLAFNENANCWHIERSVNVGMTRVAGITFDEVSSRWIVVSSKERTARCVDLSGRVSDDVRLPGRQAEGICILPDGRTILVHESDGISIIDGLSDWIRSADRFSP